MGFLCRFSFHFLSLHTSSSSNYTVNKYFTLVPSLLEILHNNFSLGYVVLSQLRLFSVTKGVVVYGSLCAIAYLFICNVLDFVLFHLLSKLSAFLPLHKLKSMKSTFFLYRLPVKYTRIAIIVFYAFW